MQEDGPDRSACVCLSINLKRTTTTRGNSSSHETKTREREKEREREDYNRNRHHKPCCFLLSSFTSVWVPSQPTQMNDGSDKIVSILSPSFLF